MKQNHDVTWGSGLNDMVKYVFFFFFKIRPPAPYLIISEIFFSKRIL